MRAYAQFLNPAAPLPAGVQQLVWFRAGEYDTPDATPQPMPASGVVDVASILRAIRRPPRDDAIRPNCWGVQLDFENWGDHDDSFWREYFTAIRSECPGVRLGTYAPMTILWDETLHIGRAATSTEIAASVARQVSYAKARTWISYVDYHVFNCYHGRPEHDTLTNLFNVNTARMAKQWSKRYSGNKPVLVEISPLRNDAWYPEARANLDMLRVGEDVMRELFGMLALVLKDKGDGVNVWRPDEVPEVFEWMQVSPA